jgi:hypothetical protein
MTAIAHHPHRVVRAVANLRSELAGVADASVWSMSVEESATTLAEIAAAKAQLAELEARVLVHADLVDVGGQRAAMSTANWLAHTTGSTRVAAHRTMRLASALEGRDLTRSALAAGRVNVERAEAIVRSVADLPDSLDAELVTWAEAHLVAGPVLRRQGPQAPRPPPPRGDRPRRR